MVTWTFEFCAGGGEGQNKDGEGVFWGGRRARKFKPRRGMDAGVDLSSPIEQADTQSPCSNIVVLERPLLYPAGDL